MPCTDTGDLSETLVCLSRELLGAPSGCDAGETVALGDSDAVDHLVLLEDGVDLHWLLEEAVAERNLVLGGAAVDLDFHKMGLLLSEGGFANLGVGENSDDGAVLLDALEFAGDGGAFGFGVLLSVLGESLLL